MERTVVFKPHPNFRDSFRTSAAKSPEIKETMRIFNEYKRYIPPKELPKKMKDHRLKPPLDAFMECHLSGDILLLYTHKGDCVNLLAIGTHDEIKGPRAKALQKSLKRYISSD